MNFSIDFSSPERLQTAQENCFLLTNGLGGYVCLNGAGGTSRGDHALFMAAVKAPNVRWNMITNLYEELDIEGRPYILTAQRMNNGTDFEGWRHLKKFSYDSCYEPPKWNYRIEDIEITREITMIHGENTVLTRYRVTNPSRRRISLSLSPLLRFTPKNDELQPDADFILEKYSAAKSAREANLNRSCFSVTGNGRKLFFVTDGNVTECRKVFGSMKWYQDERDGRRDTGIGIINHTVAKTSSETEFGITIIYSLEPFCAFSAQNGEEFSAVFDAAAAAERARIHALVQSSKMNSSLGRQLAAAADAYVVKRESTNGLTIIAGYPFFEDWGRDTMISLGGITLAARRFGECRSILSTFAKYVKDGLLPNLFPEGGASPMYNSADAPLLFVNAVYEYVMLSGDTDFLCESFSPMKNIMDAYEHGTDYHIKCDADGLIMAGAGLEQLTWMDVRIGDFLPTPRHGKPVEINAYWYSALCAMSRFAKMLGGDLNALAAKYEQMAALAKASFTSKFPNPKNGGLKDVLSGTYEENQIRCNQIWALTMPFTMLDAELEEQILDLVERELYTTAGLRTLSMKDENFHGIYLGSMENRDRAYHQGTVWTFPLGAYLRARIRRLSGYDGIKFETETAKLKRAFDALEEWLCEGCLGHLAEIYDGKEPTVSRGCFAQAWSVGEILRAVSDWESFSKNLRQKK